MSVDVGFLGQAGFKFASRKTTLYFDPYLSHSVEALDSPDLLRQTPIPIQPEEVTDADVVLISHAHIDHCDPHTLPILAKASRGCHFIAPAPVLKILSNWGISTKRLRLARESWEPVTPELEARAVPAAHPTVERDDDGNLSCIGFLLRNREGQTAYFAGDTSLEDEVLSTLKRFAPIDTCLLPVNERNYFRDRRGIIGNMTVREALGLAKEVGARRVFPYHWDMFAANGAFPDEIELIARRVAPSLELLQSPFTLFR